MTRTPTILLCFLFTACAEAPPADAVDTDTDTDTDDTDVTYLPEPGTLVKDLQVGHCGAPADESVWVERFLLLDDCTQPHRFEVAGRYDLDHAEYPGHTTLLKESYERCQPIFAAYVGKAYWDSVYDLTSITPSPSSWAGGDRDVVCLVKTLDRTPLSERAQGSGR